MQDHTQNSGGRAAGPRGQDSRAGHRDPHRSTEPKYLRYLLPGVFVLELFSEQGMDETNLVREAQDLGWVTPGEGTLLHAIGNLLELHDVPVTHYEDANTFTLANELAQGHNVIISTDSGELWNQEDPVMEGVANAAEVEGGDYAMIVSSIDTSDPNNPQVSISDPGTGEAVASYPLDQFVAAWQYSDFQMVSTQDPAPSSVSGMENFDYDAGHIPTVAGMSYDEFLIYEDDPAAFDDVLDSSEVGYGFDNSGEIDSGRDYVFDDSGEIDSDTDYDFDNSEGIDDDTYLRFEDES